MSGKRKIKSVKKRTAHKREIPAAIRRRMALYEKYFNKYNRSYYKNINTKLNHLMRGFSSASQYVHRPSAKIQNTYIKNIYHRYLYLFQAAPARYKVISDGETPLLQDQVSSEGKTRLAGKNKKAALLKGDGGQGLSLFQSGLFKKSNVLNAYQNSLSLSELYYAKADPSAAKAETQSVIHSLSRFYKTSLSKEVQTAAKNIFTAFSGREAQAGRMLESGQSGVSSSGSRGKKSVAKVKDLIAQRAGAFSLPGAGFFLPAGANIQNLHRNDVFHFSGEPGDKSFTGQALSPSLKTPEVRSLQQTFFNHSLLDNPAFFRRQTFGRNFLSYLQNTAFHFPGRLVAFAKDLPESDSLQKSLQTAGFPRGGSGNSFGGRYYSGLVSALARVFKHPVMANAASSSFFHTLFQGTSYKSPVALSHYHAGQTTPSSSAAHFASPVLRVQDAPEGATLVVQNESPNVFNRLQKYQLNLQGSTQKLLGEISHRGKGRLIKTLSALGELSGVSGELSSTSPQESSYRLGSMQHRVKDRGAEELVARFDAMLSGNVDAGSQEMISQETIREALAQGGLEALDQKIEEKVSMRLPDEKEQVLKIRDQKVRMLMSELKERLYFQGSENVSSSYYLRVQKRLMNREILWRKDKSEIKTLGNLYHRFEKFSEKILDQFDEKGRRKSGKVSSKASQGSSVMPGPGSVEGGDQILNRNFQDRLWVLDPKARQGIKVLKITEGTQGQTGLDAVTPGIDSVKSSMRHNTIYSRLQHWNRAIASQYLQGKQVFGDEIGQPARRDKVSGDQISQPAQHEQGAVQARLDSFVPSYLQHNHIYNRISRLVQGKQDVVGSFDAGHMESAKPGALDIMTNPAAMADLQHALLNGESYQAQSSAEKSPVSGTMDFPALHYADTVTGQNYELNQAPQNEMSGAYQAPSLFYHEVKTAGSESKVGRQEQESIYPDGVYEVKPSETKKDEQYIQEQKEEREQEMRGYIETNMEWITQSIYSRIERMITIEQERRS